MNNLIKLVKGIAIGIANVIPGFSGGTMALMLNIYDEFVSAFADVVRHPIQIIRKSWAIFIGIAIGVVVALFTVVKLLEVALFPTIMFFIGLIFGIMPENFKKTSFKEFKISYVLVLFITILVVVGLPLLNETSLGKVDVNVWFVLSIALMGVLSSSAMVIPGISGSMILMVFGYYTYIMNTIQDGVLALTQFNFASVTIPVLIVTAFLVGVVIGIVIISRLVRKIYTKHTNLFNIGVVGLLMSSPVAILIASNKEYSGMLFQGEWWVYLIGLFTLTAGIVLSLYGERLNKRLLNEPLDEEE